ncbi:hypothetical protein ACFT0G_31225 [Streptomyces sp. NPDC057020]|uniref:hypothetical protein n=1 Tax=unclassified Streptomyces TaxID=2593676 RepID=UPI003625B67D
MAAHCADSRGAGGESYPGKNIAAAITVLNGIICGWYVKWQRKRTGSAAEQAPSSS